jgi:hypothetical protein
MNFAVLHSRYPAVNGVRYEPPVVVDGHVMLTVVTHCEFEFGSLVSADFFVVAAAWHIVTTFITAGTAHQDSTSRG